MKKKRGYRPQAEEREEDEECAKNRIVSIILKVNERRYSLQEILTGRGVTCSFAI